MATKARHFGSFFGPGSGGEKDRNTYYYGRIKGPIDISFGRQLNIIADELKVVEHFEPLILIGTDILVDKADSNKFCYVGLHPEKRTGMIVFKNMKGEMVEVPLASWPNDGAVKRTKPPRTSINKPILNFRRRNKVRNVCSP